jgi:hypothetical protein
MIKPEVGQYWKCKFKDSEDYVIWQVLKIYVDNNDIMVREIIVCSTSEQFEVGYESSEPITNYEPSGAITDYTLDKTFNSPLYKVLNG